MQPDTQITIRQHTDSDIPFIQNSWLHSYRESAFAKDIPKDLYFKFHHKVIERILERKSVNVLIASTNDDENLILGYIVVESVTEYAIFHYLYVKRAFSDFGISHKLIASSPFPIQDGVYASHCTPAGKKIIYKYNLRFCPYLL